MIYAKTAQGLAAMQDRSVRLTPRQRSAFIMFDGKRDVSEVLKMTAGFGVVQSDLDHLVSLGLLEISGAVTQAAASPPDIFEPQELVPPVDMPTPTPSPSISVKANGMPTMSAQAHYSMAYPIATRLTAALGLRGFRLNLAVESAGDLDKLKALAPKILEAVGPEKYKELDEALNF